MSATLVHRRCLWQGGWEGGTVPRTIVTDLPPGLPPRPGPPPAHASGPRSTSKRAPGRPRPLRRRQKRLSSQRTGLAPWTPTSSARGLTWPASASHRRQRTALTMADPRSFFFRTSHSKNPSRRKKSTFFSLSTCYSSVSCLRSPCLMTSSET
jgi:hypothetical protein